LASFLLLSFPAISQSVTVVNGDTLVCFPEPMVRQIMVDLETGDFCQKEKQSYLRDIENLRKLASIREQEYENTAGRLNDCQGIVKEKDLQIRLKNDEIQALKREKNSKFWNGAAIGFGTGVVGVAILLLL
jgi:hypothetical protein